MIDPEVIPSVLSSGSGIDQQTATTTQDEMLSMNLSSITDNVTMVTVEKTVEDKMDPTTEAPLVQLTEEEGGSRSHVKQKDESPEGHLEQTPTNCPGTTERSTCNYSPEALPVALEPQDVSNSLRTNTTSLPEPTLPPIEPKLNDELVNMASKEQVTTASKEPYITDASDVGLTEKASVTPGIDIASIVSNTTDSNSQAVTEESSITTPCRALQNENVTMASSKFDIKDSYEMKTLVTTCIVESPKTDKDNNESNDLSTQEMKGDMETAEGDPSSAQNTTGNLEIGEDNLGEEGQRDTQEVVVGEPSIDSENEKDMEKKAYIEDDDKGRDDSVGEKDVIQNPNVTVDTDDSCHSNDNGKITSIENVVEQTDICGSTDGDKSKISHDEGQEQAGDQKNVTDDSAAVSDEVSLVHRNVVTDQHVDKGQGDDNKVNERPSEEKVETENNSGEGSRYKESRIENNIPNVGITKPIGSITALRQFVVERFDDSIDDDDDDNEGALQIDTEAESDGRQLTDMETDDNEIGSRQTTQVSHDSGHCTESSNVDVPTLTHEKHTEETGSTVTDNRHYDIPQTKSNDDSSVAHGMAVQQNNRSILEKNDKGSESGSGTQENNRETGNDMVTMQTELGAVIKIENVGDYASFSGEQGDILDILNGPEKTKKTQRDDNPSISSVESVGRNGSSESGRKRKRMETFRIVDSTIHPVHTLVSEDMVKKIKQEPTDDYSVYNSFYSNSENQTTGGDGSSNGNNISSERMVAPVAAQIPTPGTISGTTPRLDSLSQLSKQVDSLSSLHDSVPFKTQAGSVPSTSFALASPSNSNILLRSQLRAEPLNRIHYQIPNNFVMMPPGVTRIPVPAIRVTSAPVQVAGQATAPIVAFNSKVPPTSLPPRPHPNFTVSSNMDKSSDKGGKSTVTNKSSLTVSSSKPDTEMASVRNVKLSPILIGVPQTSSTKTTTATSTTSSSTVATASTSQKPLKPLDTLPISSINIDTVGLQVITELIARKNPIANYKAPPIPPNLCKPGEDSNGHVCYECGDTFILASSMEQHYGRCSMKITYKCEDCRNVKIFFNKCQFLNHLRGHLNIEKTQAVPIHIKSDSIMIEQLPKSHQHLLFQIPVTSEKTKIQSTLKKCSECGTPIPNEKFGKHFGKKDDAVADTFCRYSCSTCRISLPTMCSQRAHRRLHSSKGPNLSPPGPFVCPECGQNFSGLSVRDITPENPLEQLCAHMQTQCFHICRYSYVSCAKCKESFETLSNLRFHLMTKMEQYYKCSMCPMAFKASETFMKHSTSVHVETSKDERKYKVIYRCHVCDSLIDDRLVLERHLSKHIHESERAAKFKFQCRYCAFSSKTSEELLEHCKAEHRDDYMKKACKKCSKLFSTWRDVAFHELLFHRDPHEKEQYCQHCSICGFFYSNVEMSRHTCLSQKSGKPVAVTVYDCSVCGEKFYTKASLKNHLNHHKNNGVLVCSHCQTGGFSLKAELIIHEANCLKASTESKKIKKPKKAKTEGIYPCERCDKEYVTKEDMNKHCKEAHGFSMLFPCHLCGLTYESQLSLRKHLKVSHEGKRHVYPCIICRKRGIRKIFSIRLQLEKHLMAKHRLARTQVDSKIFNEYLEPDNEGGPPLLPNSVAMEKEKTNVEDSKVHDSPVKRLHVVGEQIFNCAKCSFSCENRQNFLDHLVKHKIDNTKQCRECGLCFAIIPSLQKHLFMVHKVVDFEKYCQDEGIELKEEEIKEEDLTPDEHSRESPEEDPVNLNPLECRVCYREFQDEMKLRAHMRTHGMAFIRNRRRERASASISPGGGSQINGNESSDSAVSNQ